MISKTRSMIEFLQTCPIISANPLFFNFGEVRDDANQVNIQSNDVALQQPYIDGSVLKRYTFNLDSFKSVAYNYIINGYANENLDDFAEVQAIIDWINEQGENRVFPDFGEFCIIDEMKTLSSNPDLLGIDTQLNPPTAIYRITIQIDYIDNTKRIWN